VALLLVSAAGAPSARAAELSPQQKAEMRTLYDKATRAYDVGKYQEAIEDYQKAYEIGGDPPMLYNIAQAYRLNNQPTEAVRFYKRYLQRAPNARNREDVERKIAEQEKAIEEQRKLQPPPPPVTPVPAPPPAATVPVGPPSPPPEAPPPATSPEATVVTPAAPPEEPSQVRTIVGWSMVGVGIAAGAVGLIEGKIAKDKADQLTSESRMNGAVMFNPEVEQQGKNANIAAIVLGVAGGAAVIGGILVLVTGGSSEGPAAEPTPVATARATVSPWLGGGIVGAGADFRF
jgi:hypothetical protein